MIAAIGIVALTALYVAGLCLAPVKRKTRLEREIDILILKGRLHTAGPRG